jgi:hypothetical protein
MFARNFRGARDLGLKAKRAEPDNVRVSLLLAQVGWLGGDLDAAEQYATEVVLRVSEGFALDRAYQALEEVYDGRHDYARLAALKEVAARHRGQGSR